MKPTLLALLLCLPSLAPAAPEEKADSKTHSLFNGKDLSGWHTDIPKADKFRKLDLTPLK